MPRRNYRRAKNGQVYAAEWPEWHVDCAAEGCDEHAIVSPLGEAMTIAEAESQAKESGEMVGWKRRGGLWHRHKHATPSQGGGDARRDERRLPETPEAEAREWLASI